MASYFLLVPLSYLLGAVPFALLLGWTRGVDIRNVGSGNIGATNLFRSVGRTWGVLAFACDACKGYIPAAFFPLMLTDSTPLSGLIFGCAAVAGHNWPVFLRFKGGKGIATSAGVLTGIAPTAVGIGLLAWLIVFWTTRYVSAGSIASAAAIAVSGWILYGAESVWLPVALTLLSLLAIWRHRSNIQRLCNGTEHQFKPANKDT